MKSLRIYSVCILLIVFSCDFSIGKNGLADLSNARKNYAKEFVYKIKPLQRKYEQALERYKNSFTRSGDLESATEANKEIQLVFEWTNISVEKGQRFMKNQQLDSLLRNFEKAVDTEVLSIKQRYKKELERIKNRYINSGDLKAALLLDEELKGLANSLPVVTGRSEYFSGLNKSEFEDWLQRQSFDFSGVFSGFTELKFKNDMMSYLSGEKERQYKYKLVTSRSLEINGGQRKGGWTIEFSKDLQSAEFKTNQNTYPIRINAKQASRLNSSKGKE